MGAAPQGFDEPGEDSHEDGEDHDAEYAKDDGQEQFVDFRPDGPKGQAERAVPVAKPT